MLVHYRRQSTSAFRIIVMHDIPSYNSLRKSCRPHASLIKVRFVSLIVSGEIGNQAKCCGDVHSATKCFTRPMLGLNVGYSTNLHTLLGSLLYTGLFNCLSVAYYAQCNIVCFSSHVLLTNFAVAEIQTTYPSLLK